MKGKILWSTLVVVLLLLSVSTGSSLLYRLLLAVVIVPLLGFAGSALSIARIGGSVKRLTPFLQVGDQMEEQFTLESHHWWPKPLLEVQHRARPFSAPGRVVTLWPYQSVTWKARIHCERRGVYEFGVLQVTSRDLFGFFHRQALLGSPQTTIIYPATVELPGFYVPSGHGWTEGMVTGRTLTPSPATAGIREYVPGDNVSHVHWASTAHFNKLMVKELEREPSGPSDAVWVVLDLFAKVQAGHGTGSTVEYGVTVAASVAKRFLDTGRTVGLAVGGADYSVVRPGTGLGQLGQILQELATVQPGSSSSLLHTSQKVASELTPKASVVVVSPAPASDITEAGTLFESWGAGVVAILLDASTFAGEAPGAGGQYHMPSATFESYVIRRGDEIDQRLDYRLRGSRQMSARHLAEVRS